MCKSSKPIIYSLIPNLRTIEGHDYIYHLSVQQAAKINNMPFAASIPCAFTQPDLPSNWEKKFSNIINRYKSISIFIRLREFSKIFQKKQERNRVFFLESFNTYEFVALALSVLFSMNKKESLLLLLRYDLSLIRKRTYLTIIKLISWKLKKKLVLLTDSDLLMKSWQKACKRPVHLVPIPHTVHMMSPPTIWKEDKCLCWWPGEPRKAKGLSTIQQLCTLHDPISSKMKLILSEETPIASMKQSLTLTLISGRLSRADYLHWLHKCDVVFLPYDPKIYANGTSGIFVEAICAGKMVLVKDKSWLAYELKRFELDQLIVDWENPYFFSHLNTLRDDSSIKKKLEKMRKAYRNFHSVESFAKTLKVILELL
ncbi:MAG: hypothetical protein KR126chlam3_00167 [Chlamydiae bacterium]|nr:hypothetical protein [Chlamydiota bacterium]